ncbi:unnamed protein product [Cuscuta campestris]|uniref:Integrase zinc-binding domain-containing protein n=1 Tax=Cuscuta campestris TaxID=132261 RepID=A0A484KKQ6_9ASTE|nr:unnamed protein product [Cuscuta campestris]
MGDCSVLHPTSRSEIIDRCFQKRPTSLAEQNGAAGCFHPLTTVAVAENFSASFTVSFSRLEFEHNSTAAVKSLETGDVINGDRSGIATFQSVVGLIWIDAGAFLCNRPGCRRRSSCDFSVFSTILKGPSKALARSWLCANRVGMSFLPGMFPFALPGAGTMPLQAPMAVSPFQTPMPQPSPFQPQLVSAVTPVNLSGALNAAGLSRPPQGTNPQITPDGHCVSVESGDGEWDIPRAHKKKNGKTIRPATSRNSAFERLGDKEEGQRKSAKLRLGQSVAHVSAFARLGEMREAEPARTQRSRSNRQEPARTRASRQEEEAESQPRVPVANRLTTSNDRVQQMEAKQERLEKKVGEKNDRDKPLAGSPFTTRVHLTPFPRKDKIDAPRFTGKEDPEIHLDSFNQSATMNGCTDEEKCLLFFQTLRNRATEWFNKLRPGSIDSFSDLALKFKAKFQENCTKRKKFTYLSTAGQRESENLTQFLTRWKEEVDKVEEMDDKTVLSLLQNGLPAGELYKEFCRKPPSTYQEAYHTAWEFAEAETQLRAKKEAGHGYKPKPVGELGKDYLQKAQEKNHQWVRPATQENDRDKDRRRNNRQREQQPAPDKEHIGMIFGGPEGGDSAAQRKNWVRSIYVGEVSAEPARRKCPRREPIVFTDRDLPPTGEDHSDPLVITMDINGVDVARVLVDTGSSVNILYLETFQKLRLCRTQLEPLKTPLSGFMGDTVEAEGSIVLPVELGSGEKTVWKRMRFIVVDIKCVHNAILGRPGINKVGAVISMPHLCMKFHTPGGVGEVKGDQRNARECYARAVKKMTKGVNVISQEITKGETREKLEPEAETVEIELHPGDSSRTVRIGANLPEDLKAEITRVLQEYAGIFAWSVADMPGIDRLIICHRLAVREGSRPVRQKKRYLASDRRDFVKKEVTGNMEAREGRMAQYKDLVLALLKGFEEFKIAQIPRAENADADLLSKLTQYAPEHVSKLARVEILDHASIEKLEVAAITGSGQCDRSNLVGADDHWMYDLMEYLMNGTLPEQEDRARKVKLRAPRFQVLDGKLYKRAFGGPLLRCLTNREAERVIAEVHEGVCAAHQMSRTLSQRIILLGYYWPTIVQDCERYVQKCRTCQVFYKYPARLPIEAEFPTFRESNYQPQQNEEDHLAELNLVEERRMAAEVKMSTYQQVVKKYHDNKVGPRYFQVGDEVLRRREASRPGDGGKLAKNWEGPYRVRAIIRPGTYRLETLDVVPVERTWSSHHLRKFYK